MFLKKLKTTGEEILNNKWNIQTEETKSVIVSQKREEVNKWRRLKENSGKRRKYAWKRSRVVNFPLSYFFVVVFFLLSILGRRKTNTFENVCLWDRVRNVKKNTLIIVCESKWKPSDQVQQQNVSRGDGKQKKKKVARRARGRSQMFTQVSCFRWEATKIYISV